MSLTRNLLLAVSLVLVACGPTSGDKADWMLDTFTEFGEGAGQIYTFSGLAKFTFERDGVGTYTSLGACGRDVSEMPFTWEHRGDDALVIVPEPGEDHVFNTNDEEWRVTPANRCTPLGIEEFRLEEVRDGVVALERTIYRGDLCLERFECSETEGDTQCDDCRTAWCDEAPPACGD